ncbi:MAG: exodeoxyribonuclease VII large subunit, partial [Myxococcota bacterium]
HPRVRLTALRSEMNRAHGRSESAVQASVTAARARIAQLGARLHALSPLAVLERGYAIALDAEGQAVRSATDVKAGAELELRVHRGRIGVTVRDVDPES